MDRKTLLEKQQLALQQLEKNRAQMRDILRIIGSTNEGQQLFRYLYLLSGGDRSPLCMDAAGTVSMEKTVLLIGRKEMYQDLRMQMDSETIKITERPEWEKPTV
jgi:hypothetical protein